jgi:hypothetical protein
MPSKFFEISLDSLPKNEGLEYRKYTPEQYGEMANALGNTQNLMAEGRTGKEILASPDSENNFGTSNTYSHFYNPSSGDRVKVDFDGDGGFSGYTNGRHRVEAAREAGLTHIPTEVSCPSDDSLQAVENSYGNGRDLTQYDPVSERNEIDREMFQPPREQADTLNKQPEQIESGGPASGSDPFANLREKYGTSQDSGHDKAIKTNQDFKASNLLSEKAPPTAEPPTEQSQLCNRTLDSLGQRLESPDTSTVDVAETS